MKIWRRRKESLHKDNQEITTFTTGKCLKCWKNGTKRCPENKGESCEKREK